MPALALPRPVLTTGQRSARLCGLALVVLMLLVFVGLSPLTAQKAVNSTGDGNLLRQGLYILVFGFVLLASQALQYPQRLLAPTLSIWLVLAWSCLSLSWSLEPSIATRRLLLTSIIIWTVFATVERAGFERSMRAFQITLIGVLALNYALVIASPATAIHQIADVVDPGLVGDWRGVLPQKNFAGALCALTVISLAFYGGWINVALRWGLILAAAYFLFRSGSKTSLSVLGVAVVVGGAYLGYNPRYRSLLIPLVIGLLSLLVLIGQFYWGDLVRSLTTGEALTGRAEIWSVVLRYAENHWLRGAGFGSFWNIGTASPIFSYTHGWVSRLGNGHNGYLDLLITIGAPGLILAVIAMILDPLVRLFASRTVMIPRGSVMIAMLVFCAGHNFSESSLFDRDMIMQLVFVFTVAMTVLATRKPLPPGRTEPFYWAWTAPGPAGSQSPAPDTRHRPGMNAQ